MKFVSILLLFIGLNTFSQIPPGYYSNALNLSGTQLKTALHNIIKGHTEFPYTSSSTDVWDMLKQTDKDPNDTNNVILFYTGWSVNAAQEWNNGNGWNREHVWSKSHGAFGTTPGAGTDAHHLRPSNPGVNFAKNNRWFDTCSTPYIEAGQSTGCFTSPTNWVWQPRDEIKGDVARMIFYMATRYEGGIGEPDLELIDYLPIDNNTPDPVYAKLTTLLQWHNADTVDSWERNRNDIIYYNFQNNRNPFIDNPAFANLIWCTPNILVGAHNETVCFGGNITVNNTVYDANNLTGTEVFPNIGPNNCDSTVTVTLTVLPALTGVNNATICSNETIFINGNPYNSATPTGTEVFTNIGPNNCDSTVNIALNVLPALTGMNNTTICNNETILINGNPYNSATPTGTEVFTNIGPNNCDSAVTINLTVLAAIDTTIIKVSPTLTANQNGATYQWLNCGNGNAIIPNETGVSFTATASGNYAVEVTVGSCVDTSACESIITLGIDEGISNAVAIYPNPSTGIVNINFGTNNGIINYDIRSVEGKLIGEGKTKLKAITLDLSKERKGIYYLRVLTEKTSPVYKLIIE